MRKSGEWRRFGVGGVGGAVVDSPYLSGHYMAGHVGVGGVGEAK